MPDGFGKVCSGSVCLPIVLARSLSPHLVWGIVHIQSRNPNYPYLIVGVTLADSACRFNWSARKLHKRLQQLGAKEIYPRGEADDQHEDG